mmetsp:Transcript_39449/g.35204  ORF Transcript_39449/g.35204 Transcript_39449/m.35204 type:complete len:102 (+) Transcript_39449:340-645(+)
MRGFNDYVYGVPVAKTKKNAGSGLVIKTTPYGGREEVQKTDGAESETGKKIFSQSAYNNMYGGGTGGHKSASQRHFTEDDNFMRSYDDSKVLNLRHFIDNG